VLKRILMHPEVLQHVVPSGGSWKRAVEALCVGMKKPRPQASTLYNKACWGMEVIRSIAEYNPASFEDDATFLPFISQVKALITTQSILQEAQGDDRKLSDVSDDYGVGGDSLADGGSPAAPSASAAPGGGGEWDF
jgi:hypothetical protein